MLINLISFSQRASGGLLHSFSILVLLLMRVNAGGKSVTEVISIFQSDSVYLTVYPIK